MAFPLSALTERPRTPRLDILEKLLMSRPTSLFTRPLLLLMAANFFQACAFTFMLLLPLYLDHLGASRAEIGAIMMVASLSGLLARPLIGWSLDRLGRRRTLRIGTTCLAVAMASYYLVTDLGPLVILARVLTGIGMGTAFTAYMTVATDIIPPQRRTEGLALFGVSGLLPMALNPLLLGAGIRPQHMRLLFPAASLLIAFSWLAIRRIDFPDREHPPPTGRRSARIWTVLLDRSLLPCWGAVAVFAMQMTVFMSFVTVCAENRKVTNPAMIWLSYAVSSVGVRIVAAHLVRRVGPRNLIAPSLALYAGALIVASAGVTSADFLLSGAMAGTAHGVAFPCLTSLVVSRSPEERRGAVLAAFTSLFDLSQLFVAPGLGLVADLRSDTHMFALAAVLSVGGLALWCAAERSHKQRTA